MKKKMGFVLFPRFLSGAVLHINRRILLLKQISIIERCRIRFLHNSVSRKCKEITNLTKEDRFPNRSVINLYSYYDDYIQNNSSRYSAVFKSDKISQNLSDETSNLLKQFEFNSDEIRVTDELKVQLKKELSGLSHDEFLLVLDFFVRNFFNKCEIEGTQEYLDVIQIIDNECLSRTSSLSFDENLKILYVLHCAPCFLNFGYSWKKIIKLCYKLKSLNHVQVVQFLHLLPKFKKIPPKDTKFEFQDILNNNVPHLNVQELGLMSYVLNKLGLIISHPELLKNILERSLPVIESLDQEIIKSISLAFEIAVKGNLKNMVNEFQEKLLPVIHKLDLNVLTHAASCGLPFSYINSTFFEEALKIAKKNISECNSFVLQRFCVMCTRFKVKDEELLKLIVMECCKRNIPPHHLVVIGKQLLCLGVFEKKILNMILTENFVNKLLCRKEKASLVDYNFIETSIEIEYPEFDGSKVSEASKKSLNKMLKNIGMSGSIENSKAQDRFLCKVENALADIYGKNAVYWKLLVQCYHPFIFMRFDENLKPQPVPEEFMACKNVKVMRPLQDGHYWIPFVLTSRYHLEDSTSFDLYTQIKMRHLNMIGYKPLLFNGCEWKKHRDEKREVEFLKGILTTHLEMIVKNETKRKQTGLL